jgi:ABC-2 type transport system permease protein
MNPAASIRSIGSVAKKEFLHIVRDWRVLILILTLPPAFTLLFGYAFEVTAMKNAPALLRDADRSTESEKLVEKLRANEAFAWREWPGASSESVDPPRAQSECRVGNTFGLGREPE